MVSVLLCLGYVNNINTQGCHKIEKSKKKKRHNQKKEGFKKMFRKVMKFNKHALNKKVYHQHSLHFAIPKNICLCNSFFFQGLIEFLEKE